MDVEGGQEGVSEWRRQHRAARGKHLRDDGHWGLHTVVWRAASCYRATALWAGNPVSALPVSSISLSTDLAKLVKRLDPRVC